MAQKHIGKMFRQYAIPQMIGLLFNSVYLLVDGIFIGRILGRESLAAAGIAVPLMECVIALSMAITSGSGAIISSELGRRRPKQANRTFHCATVIALVISSAIVILSTLFTSQIASMLGATDEILPEAAVYLRTVMSGTVFQMFSFFLGGMARNDQKPRLAMIAMTVGAFSNIVLDWLFIDVFQMGIFGAALATAIGPLISCAILLPSFFTGQGELRLSKDGWSFHHWKDILVSGIPSFILEFTIGMITFLMNRSISRHHFGEIGLAAYLLIGYAMLIWLTLYLGMAEGLQPLFSRFEGEGNHADQEGLRKYAQIVFIITGIVCYGALLLFSKDFMSIFAPQDPELVRFAAEQCPAYFFGFIFAGWGILYIAYWQSTQKTVPALILSIARAFIFPMILLLFLPILFGAESIWFAHSAAEICSVCLIPFLSKVSTPRLNNNLS